VKKIVVGLVLLGTTLFGHSALMRCFDNGNAIITCEGGYSDGSSANGVDVYVEQNQKALIRGKMSESSEFSFRKPNGAYRVVLDAGEGHRVSVDGKEIVE
jgi:hypothetical protein